MNSEYQTPIQTLITLHVHLNISQQLYNVQKVLYHPYQLNHEVSHDVQGLH